MNTNSFRSLVIDLLDSADGIPEPTYQKLIKFAEQNHANTCDDVWAATDGGDGDNGFCVYLNENAAEELRKQ